jgi:hypothetical protein
VRIVPIAVLENDVQTSKLEMHVFNTPHFQQPSLDSLACNFACLLVQGKVQYLYARNKHEKQRGNRRDQVGLAASSAGLAEEYLLLWHEHVVFA